MMQSKNIILLFALAGLTSLVAADHKKRLLRKNERDENNVDMTEDIAFWTRMTQEVSMPTEPTSKPTSVTPSPTVSDIVSDAPTMSSVVTDSPTITPANTDSPTQSSVVTDSPTSAVATEPPTSTSTNPRTNPPVPTGGVVVANDDDAAIFAGFDAFISVLDNDIPADPADPLIVKSIVEDASNGLCAISLDIREVVYTPNSGFIGSDTCVYEACDSVPLCDTATVFITVSDL
eukprot:CAMPEP_0171341346 /NCGR_PEP_ID=MMETSP0878-20121228/10134_1 /TAXON_ID=67004 /ORGANISM="Thalassiosira weissflogii, Strain CCMP1336" /LENGTH=232 /DNA_ID=CAMNT_0011843563 /DNA_START=66 /DNA_END=764 /DNA_ORIENTATION=-